MTGASGPTGADDLPTLPPVDPRVLAERALAQVRAGEQAVVTADVGRHALTRFANSHIHQNVADDRVTVTVQLVVDGRVASASTTRHDDDGLTELVARARAAAEVSPPDPGWPGLTAPAPTPDGNPADATLAATPAERAAIVEAFVRAGDGTAAAGYCDTEYSHTVVANSAGHVAEGRSSRATLDGIHRIGDAAGSGHGTSNDVRDLDGERIGREAAERAAASVDPVDVEPGDYEVVLGPECVATIVMFLSVYGFNAKQHQQGQSFAELGAGQFDPAITLVDDGTDPRAIAYGFDGEASPKCRHTLIDGGTTSALTHDRRTAAKVGASTTGHAAPSLYGNEVGPFASNLFLAPGSSSVEELIGSVERGLLVTTFNYVRVIDPKTIGATGLTRNGTFLISDGAVAGAVSNLRFTQSFVEALAPGAIAAVGRDARLADAEFGPGFAHVPSLHLRRWRFTGGAAG
ncbi:MAG: TldD/PmbA family protein [Actinomycetota bacterium]|nr:TldD/PmbA family protein [Actinomycetota bacterium]